MLGGYYLGQLYLGISGLPSSGTLSVQNASHQLSSDNINLTQKHTLVVNSAVHTLTSGNITLIQKHALTVENASHTLMSENVALTSEHFLGVNDAYHSLTSTEIQLTQKHTIVVENTTHSLSSGNLDLVEHKTLEVNNTQHGHAVDSVTISVRSYLDISNGIHGLSFDNTVLTQKHTLAINNAAHALISDALGGLINIQPYGTGGGFGAVDGWGVAEFGAINIELPLNFLVLAEDSYHELSSDELDTFIQIFNMIRTGDYIKDYGSSGNVGSEYSKATGTMPNKNPDFGEVTPVSESNHGFFIVDVVSSGSYNEKSRNTGNVFKANSSEGTYSTDEEDTGSYVKIK